MFDLFFSFVNLFVLVFDCVNIDALYIKINKFKNLYSVWNWAEEVEISIKFIQNKKRIKYNIFQGRMKIKKIF